MKKILFVALVFTFITSMAFAKKMDQKEKLIEGMVKACKTDLAKAPALTDTSDGEVVWRNLEDKENGDVRLSKACHRAHEKYEHKYHKENDEHEAAEHNG